MENNQEQKKETQKKDNIFVALLLSFLVAVAGAALWGVLYYYGIFAAIVSYITAFGMIAVYKCFAKKNNVLPWIWSAIWIIVLTILSAFLTLLIALVVEYDVTMKGAINLLKYVWSEVSGIFYKDFILGIIFALLGLGCYFAVWKRNEIMKEKAEKIISAQVEQQIAKESKTIEQAEKTKLEEVVEKVETKPQVKKTVRKKPVENTTAEVKKAPVKKVPTAPTKTKSVDKVLEKKASAKATAEKKSAEGVLNRMRNSE